MKEPEPIGLSNPHPSYSRSVDLPAARSTRGSSSRKRVYGASSSAARDAWQTKRFDVAVQEKLMDALVADNEATLTAARIPINDANMYIMHVLGSGNGPKFLKASPGAPVSDILSVEIVKQNPTYFGGGNASTLTMGILGQGAPVSFETITSMAASGEIDEDDAVRLATFLESRTDRVVAEAERQEAARSREQQRAADDLVESEVSRLILPALTGKKTPEQVRSDALTSAARLARTHPLEAAKIISGANSALGGIEGTREGTTGYRDVITTFDKNDRDFFAGKAIRMQGVPTRRREELVKFTHDLVTRGAQRLQRELLNGADPAKSAEAVRLWITQQMNLKAAQYATAAR